MRVGGASGGGVALVVLAIGALAGAGCSVEMLRSGTQGGGGGAGGSGVRDAAVDAGSGPVRGIFAAPGVSASISYPGGGAFLARDSQGSSAMDFFLATPGVGPSPQLAFDEPAVVSGQLAVSLQIPTPTVGVTQSEGACGNVGVLFYEAAATDAACGALTDAGVCPPGCALKIDLIANGGWPCYAPSPTFLYQAVGTAACAFDTPAAGVGAWTLSLTSLVHTSEVSGDVELDGYLAHGTLTAQLAGGLEAGDGGLSAGELRVEF
ncbi:MAG TPA: hypothetical protein VHO06_19625 [Polyangia bacterium]|nr:hypothetical protein [Polyangia bacterium]